MKISVFNGGGQTDYMFGLVSGLFQFKDDRIVVLDSNLNASLFNDCDNVSYIDVIKVLSPNESKIRKAINMLRFYLKQLFHLTFSERGIVHFQWLDRFYVPDRIILPGWARLMGHKVILTVHNVNSKKRDNKDTWINQVTLKAIYRISHRLIVHTLHSKSELMKEFSVSDGKIEVIRHGMNNKVSLQGLSVDQARNTLKLGQSDKVVLFFGNIDYYKGVDLLLDSLRFIPDLLRNEIRILIAGNAKSKEYSELIKKKISDDHLTNSISLHIHHIPDDEVETFFMAADCIMLPYRNIYQSGVIFMSYTFGLPVIVPDIGNFRNDLEQGKTGLLAVSNEPKELAASIVEFFGSHMYENPENSRGYIKKWATDRYSWESIGKDVHNLYKSLLQ